MGCQIQRAGSAVSAVWIVEDLEERVLNRAEKVLAQREVDVHQGVKGERCRIVCVPDGRCFRAGRAGRYGRRCTRIERRDDSCGQEGEIDGGGVNLTLSANHPVHPCTPAKISAHVYTQNCARICAQQRTISPNFADQ